MQAEDELKLSYYKEVADINKQHDVTLVRHIQSGRFFVRKKFKAKDPQVLRALMDKSFPGVPKIYECIPDDEDFIIIEEYISGQTLSEYLLENGVPGEEVAARIIIQMCDILRRLHENDPVIVHRDIKPSNIIMMEDGSVYLLDFDAGKMVDEGKGADTVLMGTHGYAAPEQYGFAQSDARTDIYALGVLFEEMIGAENMPASKLRYVIEKCKEMNPNDRFQNVRELKAAITDIMCDTKSEKKTADRLRNDNDKSSDMRYSNLPPGYASKRPALMIVATLWYAFIIYFAFNRLTPEDAARGLGRADYVLISLAMLISTFVIGNYRGIARKVPLLRSDNSVLKIIGALTVVLISFVVMAMLATLFD